MKLWQKISLVCGTILIALVGICTAVQLRWASNRILNIAKTQALEKQGNLHSSFSQMMDYYSAEEDSPAVSRSLLHYCFTRFTDDTGVLIQGDDTIFSRVDFNPQDYLCLEEGKGTLTWSGEIDGRNFFLAGSYAKAGPGIDSICQVYVVEDITPIYSEIHQMTIQFLLIGAGTAALGLALIILLVRKSLAPLARLQLAASHIAQGDYCQRAEITSKDEVGLLGHSFNQMAESVQHHIEELTETAQRQKLFIGAVTHEFKTPLTSILLNVDSLQNTYMTEEERTEALSSIETQGKWLERMVQKMLKLITVEKEIQMTEVDVPELLEQVRLHTAQLLAQRGVNLQLQCQTLTLNGDKDLLLSVLVNLVDNAAKASQPGQVIELYAYENTFEIVDHGAGIPKEALTHVTEPFYMADKSRSKRSGGVGLGLALVKEIVEAHGAKLDIDSLPGHGTVVMVRFPR